MVDNYMLGGVFMKNGTAIWQLFMNLFKLISKVIFAAILIFLILIAYAAINVELSEQLSYAWLAFAAATWFIVLLIRRKKKLEKSRVSKQVETKEAAMQSVKPFEVTKEKPEQPTIDHRSTELERQKEERFSRCKYDLVVIDFETTGLNSNFISGRMDEVLSVAIIDQDGNTLLSTLCGTSDRKTWENAEEVHGISPAMVDGMPTFSEIFPQVKEILYSAKKVIAYNIPFEMGFLWAYDSINDFPGGTKIREMVDWGADPMLMFAAYKGELSKYGDIKWHKLAVAAKHFKYAFKAHDALEDVKATLHIYNALIKYVATHDDKEYILKYGMCYKKPDH